MWEIPMDVDLTCVALGESKQTQKSIYEILDKYKKEKKNANPKTKEKRKKS